MDRRRTASPVATLRSPADPPSTRNLPREAVARGVAPTEVAGVAILVREARGQATLGLVRPTDALRLVPRAADVTFGAARFAGALVPLAGLEAVRPVVVVTRFA